MTTVSSIHTTHIMIRSRSMSLLQEDLARARLRERLAEAEASRLARGARANEAAGPRRYRQVSSRARLLVGLGRATGSR
jgi:hypothetical protein